VWTQAANCAVGSSGGACFYASSCNIFKKIFFTLCWRILVLSQLWPPILLRKCVCPTTQAPFGIIPVVGKLGSYSNLLIYKNGCPRAWFGNLGLANPQECSLSSTNCAKILGQKPIWLAHSSQKNETMEAAQNRRFCFDVYSSSPWAHLYRWKCQNIWAKSEVLMYGEHVE
jgi:hypothetical protein